MLESLITPSYAQGFARSKGEAANPGLWDGLMWAGIPMLGPSGATLYDISGNHQDGVLTNMEIDADWIDDTELGTALNFDGPNEYVDTGFNLGTPAEMSCVFIGKTFADSDFEYMLDTSNGSTGFALRRNNVNFIAFFCYRSGGGISLINNAPYTDGGHLVHVGVMEAGRIVLYVDGIQIGQNSNAIGPLISGPDLNICAEWNNSNVVEATANAVLIYNRALSHAEVLQFTADPRALVRMKDRALFVPEAPPAGVPIPIVYDYYRRLRTA